jgi:hypothetical protein
MMKRKMAVALAVFAIGVAPFSLLAQMAPPGPLEDDLCKWMIGDWEGTTEWTMGKANDEMEVDWDLERQFVGIHYKQKNAETDPAKLEAMAKAMGITKEQAQMPYKGQGFMTINPQTKEYIGFWFDSFRIFSQGKGTRAGNKITMTWTDVTGTAERTIEKAGEDKLVMTFKNMDPQGKVVAEGTTTLMRKMKKAKADKKS